MCAVTQYTWGTRERERGRDAVFVVSSQSVSVFAYVHSFLVHALWLKMFAFVSHSISRSSPCLMGALSDFLFDLSICFTFLLFIIFSFQHFLLLFTFLEVK